VDENNQWFDTPLPGRLSGVLPSKHATGNEPRWQNC
jgi:hypothetical protein